MILVFERLSWLRLNQMKENDEVNIETWASSLMELDNLVFEKENTPTYPQLSSALVSIGPSTYYRSKGFSSSISINHLISSLDPLLTLITKLQQITTPPDAATLYQNLCHEIKAFENKAQTVSYRSQIISAAKYLICALLDELIVITPWVDTEWEKYNLVTSFYKEKWSDDQFFLILQRSLEDPGAHIDLLEFIFLCLKLGYEGKYRTMDRGHLELQSITVELYRVISHYREGSSKSLHITLENPNYPQALKRNYLHLLPPTWLISSLLVLLVVGIFSFFSLKLMDVASPIYQFIDTLNPGKDNEKVPAYLQ